MALGGILLTFVVHLREREVSSDPMSQPPDEGGNVLTGSCTYDQLDT